MPELGEVLQGTSDEHQPLRLSQLQDVNLLQLGHILPLRLQADCHDVFQLIKTDIDPGPPLSLQQGLCDFLILMLKHNLWSRCLERDSLWRDKSGGFNRSGD